MAQSMILTGEINLLGVADPEVPFARVKQRLKSADFVFANLECCLYEQPDERVLTEFGVDGFYALRESGKALKDAGFSAVGTANNQNYGKAAVTSSLVELDKLGILHTGSGLNRAAAEAPVVFTKNGTRFGVLQRTSHYWPRKHEAGSRTPGVAILKINTAYQPPFDENKPGAAPRVITWTDPEYLARFREQLRSLRAQCDIMISSHHWGLGWEETICDYQIELAHAAIDEGADVVFGHGSHLQSGIEVYREKAVFYGACAFSFGRSNKKKHGDWVGQMVTATLENRKIIKVSFVPVRHNEKNETLLCDVRKESASIEHLTKLSHRFGTAFDVRDDEVVVWEAKERAPGKSRG